MLLDDDGGGDTDVSTDVDVEPDDALICTLELRYDVEPVSVRVVLEDRDDLGTVRDPVRVLELLLAK